MSSYLLKNQPSSNPLSYGIAALPTPLFNTARFPYHASSLAPFKTAQGLLKNIEMIAFPGSKFVIQKEISETVVEVAITEYPCKTPLYVDRRFLITASPETPEREKKMPPSPAVLESMVSNVGARYFWGGNWAHGIPEMRTFYPHLACSSDFDDVVCKGIDCSGLLYQATGGATPRNTSQLIHYGQEIEVDQQSLQEVRKKIQPLDMLVWSGHVVFVLTREALIESLGGQGVIITSFQGRYPQILEKVCSENKTLYLRRWHSDFLES